jgi:hypothetical protein
MAHPHATRVSLTDEAVHRSPREPMLILPDELRDPLDRLRALAGQDLSPMERALVEGEIQTWERHRLLQAWQRR